MPQLAVEPFHSPIRPFANEQVIEALSVFEKVIRGGIE